MNLPKKALLLVALCAVILIGAFYFYSTNPQTLSAANSAANFQGKQVDLIVDSSQIPDTYLAKGPSLKLPTALKTSITKVSSSSKGGVTSEKLAAATQLCPSQWDEDGKCYKYVASNVAAATNTDCSKLTGIAKSTCLLKANAKQAVKLTCNQDVAVPQDQETKECGEKPQTQQPTKTPSNQSAPANGSFKSGRTPRIDCFHQFNAADNTITIGWHEDQLGEHHMSLHLKSDGTRVYNINRASREFTSAAIQVNPVAVYDLVVTAPYNGRTLDCQQEINLAEESVPILAPSADEGPLLTITDLQVSGVTTNSVTFNWVSHRQYQGPAQVINLANNEFSVQGELTVYKDLNNNNQLDVNEPITSTHSQSVPTTVNGLTSDTTYKVEVQLCSGATREGCGPIVKTSFRTKPNAMQSAIASASANDQADLTLLDGVAASAGQSAPLGVSGASSDSATNSLIRNGLIGRTNSPVIGVISNVRDRLSAGIQTGLAQAGAHDGDAIPIDESSIPLVSRFTLSAGQAANQNVASDFQAKGQLQTGLNNLAVNGAKPNQILLALTAITQTREASNLTLWLLKANTVDLNTQPNKKLATFTLAERTSSFTSLRAGNYIIAGKFCTQLNRCEINASTFTLTADGKLISRRDVSEAIRAQLQQPAAPVQPNPNENQGVLPAAALVVSPIKVTKAATLGFTNNVDVKWSTQPKANYTLVLKSSLGGLALTSLKSAAMTLDNAVKISAKPGSYNLSVFACAGNKNCKLSYVYFKVAANGAVTMVNAAPVAANGELAGVNLTATQLPKEGQHFAVNVTWITNVNANATLTVTRLTDDSNVPVAAPVGYNKGRSVKVPIHENVVPANFKATITSCTAANVCITNETQFNVNSNGAVSVIECDPLTMAQCPALNDEQSYDLTINSYIWAVNGLKLTLTNPNTDAITITEVSVGGDPGQNFAPVELQPDETKVINWPYGCGISGYQAGDQYNEDLAIKYDTFLGPQVKYATMQGGCSDVLNPDQEGNGVNGANAELAFNATLTGLQASQNSLDLTWEATLPNSHNLTLYEIDSNARLNQIQAGDLNGVRVINIASPFVVDGVLMLDGNSPFRLNVPGLKPNTLYLGFMTLCAAPNLGLQCVDLDIQAFTRDASQAQFESDTCPIRKVNGRCTASVQISKAGVAQANRVELYPRDVALRKFIQLTMDNTLDQECLEQAFALSYGGFDELNILYSIRGFAVPFQVENDIYKLVNANIADGICN